MVETKVYIIGLDCMDCAKDLESAVKALPDVAEAAINFYEGTLSVKGSVDPDRLSQTVKKLGYEVSEKHPMQQEAGEEPNVLIGFWRYLFQRLETRLALIGAVLVLLGLILSLVGVQPWIIVSLQMAALGLAGWPVVRSGLVNLWVNKTFNIDFLMSLAGIGAVVIGEYAEAVALILLFALAEAMEGFTNDRARKILSGLTDLTPAHAVKIQDGQENIVHVDTLEVDDWVIIRPGERIPLDGTIIEGQSDINQAPITGESMPVWKGIGEEVFSGTVNGSGRLIVIVTRLVADSTLQRIVALVTEAQSRHTKSQKFIDKFARVYTPIMVILAIAVAVLPPLLLGEPLLNLDDGTRGWLYRALALLVISCPCALVISTPVTMVASLTRAVKEGVLFKGGIFMETLTKINAFAFDKTGTLTRGEPVVVDSKDLACQDEIDCEPCNDLIALAYALERHSSHPIAQAIIKEAELRSLTDCYPAAKNLVMRGGMGIEGDINGSRMAIGSLRLFEQEHVIPGSVYDWVAKAETAGQTAMLLCDGDNVRGFIAVADTQRAESKDVIKALNQQGRQTIMLTGDNAAVAKVIGESVGLSQVRSNLLPEDKQEAVASLREQYGLVAMVGDGINDAPALAAADLGIAMGGSGSAQALETADVVLMADSLDKLPFAVRLSQFANRLIHQNIVFSLGSKILVAVAALLGYAPLWMAVLADMGVSLLVTLNGLRALRFERRKVKII